MAEDGTIAQQTAVARVGAPARLPLPARERLDYPDSDGRFLPENPIHARTVVNLRSALTQHFRKVPNVVVEGDMFVYYECDNPAASIAPDLLVVLNHDLGGRLTYKLWVEGRPLDFALEVVSPSSAARNARAKRELYAGLGVREYFRFQPEPERPAPRLVGHRLQGRAYAALGRDSAGAVCSGVLGLSFRPEGTNLRVRDLASGKEYELLDELHAAAEMVGLEKAARRRAEARLEFGAEARRRAEARAATAEARIAELESLLLEARRRAEDRA